MRTWLSVSLRAALWTLALSTGAARGTDDAAKEIGERLFTRRPQRDAGMRPHGIQQNSDGLRNRAAVASQMQLAQQLEGLGRLHRRGRERTSVYRPHRIDATGSERAVLSDFLAEEQNG